VLILFVTLCAAVFHYFSRHPELAAGLASLLPIVIGIGVLFSGAVNLIERLIHSNKMAHAEHAIGMREERGEEPIHRCRGLRFF